jgi:hypothetical protein
MPIAKTGNPFCPSIDLPECLAETEAGRILQNHFQVFLVAISIDRNGKLISAFGPLPINAGRTCGPAARNSTTSPIDKRAIRKNANARMGR